MRNILYNTLFVTFLFGLIATEVPKGDQTQTQKNATTLGSNSSSISKNKLNEGGPVLPTVGGTHRGREVVVEPPVTVTNKLAPIHANLSKLVQSEQGALASEAEVPPVHDPEKPSVPKKGVQFPPSEPPLNIVSTGKKSNETKNTNTTSIINAKVANKNSPIANLVHKKPLVTESDPDFINSKLNKGSSSKANLLDQSEVLLGDEKSNQSDYIVPIVAVILSVPLVAILINVVYKRGTYWWQHRNYRRMDFLIEGMYHN